MDKQTKEYRKAQFKKISSPFNKYKPIIKIIKYDGETNWMDIEETEFEGIKNLLTK